MVIGINNSLNCGEPPLDAASFPQIETVAAASFTDNFTRNSRREIRGSTGTITISSRQAALSTGTAVGSCRLYVQDHFPVGCFDKLLCRQSITLAAGVAGVTQTWGAGSLYMDYGHFFQLSGTTLQIIRVENGSIIETVTAANWNVVNTITADTQFHIWDVRLLDVGAYKVGFYRDNILVHTQDHTALSIAAPGNVFLSSHFKIENTTTQDPGATAKVLTLVDYYENAGIECTLKDLTVSNSDFIPVTSGSWNPVIALNARHTSPNYSLSYRSIQLDRLDISATRDCRIRIKLNPQISGANPAITYGALPDPSTAWSGMTNPITTSLNGTTATGTGYSNSNTVQYKITALGSVGETLASVATTSLNVGNPKQQVSVVWNRISRARGYNVYRQVNGTGTFDLIATTFHGHYTDNADTARNVQPPVTNTSEGDSLVRYYDPPSTITGGTVLGLKYITQRSHNSILLDSNVYCLYPGEVLSIEVDPDANCVISASLCWKETIY